MAIGSPEWSTYGDHHSAMKAQRRAEYEMMRLWMERAEATIKEPPKPKTALPISTHFGEFVGYRFWALHRGHLKSASNKYLWMPGTVAGLQDGQKIEDYGAAGIHAFKEQRRMLLESYSGDIVFGTVKLWGDVIEYEHGFHAEFASITSLDHADLPTMKAHERTILQELRERYGVNTQSNIQRQQGSL